ncbi:hypothetical protein KSU66_09245 [Sporosarcina sp. G11-34]|nr:hypothetical protein [Sporosarcina sp. G11-34]
MSVVAVLCAADCLCSVNRLYAHFRWRYARLPRVMRGFTALLLAAKDYARLIGVMLTSGGAMLAFHELCADLQPYCSRRWIMLD